MKPIYSIRTVDQLKPGDTVKCSFLGSDQKISTIDLDDKHAILETGLKYYGLDGKYLVLANPDSNCHPEDVILSLSKGVEGSNTINTLKHYRINALIK